MNDRQMFKELNGINYDDEEIKEYMDITNIEDKKLNSITNDVKTNLAKEKFGDLAGLAQQYLFYWRREA